MFVQYIVEMSGASEAQQGSRRDTAATTATVLVSQGEGGKSKGPTSFPRPFALSSQSRLAPALLISCCGRLSATPPTLNPETSHDPAQDDRA